MVLPPEGQDIELGTAEMNLFLLLGACTSRTRCSLSAILTGTVYDTFARGLDALNYACYRYTRERPAA